ncbi:hypothetical protein Tco_1484684 [Tanacetum coccineum]
MLEGRNISIFFSFVSVDISRRIEIANRQQPLLSITVSLVYNADDLGHLLHSNLCHPSLVKGDGKKEGGFQGFFRGIQRWGRAPLLYHFRFLPVIISVGLSLRENWIPQSYPIVIAWALCVQTGRRPFLFSLFTIFVASEIKKVDAEKDSWITFLLDVVFLSSSGGYSFTFLLEDTPGILVGGFSFIFHPSQGYGKKLPFLFLIFVGKRLYGLFGKVSFLCWGARDAYGLGNCLGTGNRVHYDASRNDKRRDFQNATSVVSSGMLLSGIAQKGQLGVLGNGHLPEVLSLSTVLPVVGIIRTLARLHLPDGCVG